VQLLLEEIKDFFKVIIKYTITSHNKSYWVGVGVPQKQGLRIPGVCESVC